MRSDLRTIKTEKSIKDACLEILKYKDFSQITVIELSKKAMINKATFYLHYKDIYDLKDEIQNDFVERMLNSFDHKLLITNKYKALDSMIRFCMNENKHLIKSLDESKLIMKAYEKIIDLVKGVTPDIIVTLSRKIQLLMVLSSLPYANHLLGKDYKKEDVQKAFESIIGAFE